MGQARERCRGECRRFERVLSGRQPECPIGDLVVLNIVMQTTMRIDELRITEDQSSSIAFWDIRNVRLYTFENGPVGGREA